MLVKDSKRWLYLALGVVQGMVVLGTPLGPILEPMGSQSQKPELLTVKAGHNISLECKGHTSDQEVRWVMNNHTRTKAPAGPPSNLGNRVHVDPDGRLVILEADPEVDNGLYSCYTSDTNPAAPEPSLDVRLRWVRLVVRSTPAAAANLTVIPHSVFALVTWRLKENRDVATGGLPIRGFVLTYKMISSHLDHDKVDMMPAEEAGASEPVVVDDIPGDSTSRSVYNLRPNSTYSFSLRAVNELGDGRNLTLMADTLYRPDEVEQARRLYFESRQQNLSNLVQVVLIAVCVVLVLVALPGGITLLLCNKGCCTGNTVRPDLVCEATEEEEMELVPHITLNPSFNIDMLEYIEPSPDQDEEDHDTANLMPGPSQSQGGPHRHAKSL